MFYNKLNCQTTLLCPCAPPETVSLSGLLGHSPICTDHQTVPVLRYLSTKSFGICLRSRGMCLQTPSAVGCAGTVNDVLWLPGDKHSQLIVATEAGNVRRISLDPSAIAATLLAAAATPMHGVLSLAYSPALKLVAYSSGNGTAAVLPCIARLPMDFVFGGNATMWSHVVPHASVFKAVVAAEEAGVDTVLLGKENAVTELFEGSRGARLLPLCSLLA